MERNIYQCYIRSCRTPTNDGKLHLCKEHKELLDKTRETMYNKWFDEKIKTIWTPTGLFDYIKDYVDNLYNPIYHDPEFLDIFRINCMDEQNPENEQGPKFVKAHNNFEAIYLTNKYHGVISYLCQKYTDTKPFDALTRTVIYSWFDKTLYHYSEKENRFIFTEPDEADDLLNTLADLAEDLIKPVHPGNFSISLYRDLPEEKIEFEIIKYSLNQN